MSDLPHLRLLGLPREAAAGAPHLGRALQCGRLPRCGALLRAPRGQQLQLLWRPALRPSRLRRALVRGPPVLGPGGGEEGLPAGHEAALGAAAKTCLVVDLICIYYTY